MRPRPWGQGRKSASHPCLRFSSQPRGGCSPGNSFCRAAGTVDERRLAPVRTAMRAADRQSPSNATPPKFTRAGATYRRAAAHRVTAGRDRLPNTAHTQREAPMIVSTIAGASFFLTLEPAAVQLVSTRTTVASAVSCSRAGRVGAPCRAATAAGSLPAACSAGASAAASVPSAGGITTGSGSSR